MITKYIRAAMSRAKYETLPDDKSIYGEIPGFQGVWANAKRLDGCQVELQEALEEWMLVRLHDGLELPGIDGIDLEPRNVDEFPPLVPSSAASWFVV
jgi:predicted RNase H-like HicB family nuclease